MSETKQIRVIIIDPVAKTVREAHLEKKDGWLQEAVGGLIEAIPFDRQTTCWVDEEGLLKDLRHGWIVDGKDDPIMGRAVIAGTDSHGETVSTTATLAQVQEIVAGWYEGDSPEPTFEITSWEDDR